MDKIENCNNNSKSSEEQLSIIDSLPSIVSWTFDGKLYKIENHNKVIAVLSKERNQIAVIEAPFEKASNKAYIINGTGEIFMDIHNLFVEKYNHIYYGNSIIFTDVYYSNNTLYFFLVSSNVDFRLKIDTINKRIGDLIESR